LIYLVAKFSSVSTRVGGIMKKQRVTAVALSTAISAGAFFASATYADKDIDAVLQVGQAKTSAAQASQKRIDKLQEDTASLLQKFKGVHACRGIHPARFPHCLRKLIEVKPGLGKRF